MYSIKRIRSTGQIISNISLFFFSLSLFTFYQCRIVSSRYIFRILFESIKNPEWIVLFYSSPLATGCSLMEVQTNCISCRKLKASRVKQTSRFPLTGTQHTAEFPRATLLRHTPRLFLTISPVAYLTEQNSCTSNALLPFLMRVTITEGFSPRTRILYPFRSIEGMRNFLSLLYRMY